MPPELHDRIACRIGLHDYRAEPPVDRKYSIRTGLPIIQPYRLVCVRCGEEKA